MELDVALVLITHNAANRIEEVLISLNNQVASYTTELIIIDDKSIDGTVEIIESFDFDLPKKIVLNDTNMGVGFNRNLALHLASSKYVCFFDDDDLPSSNRVQSQLECVMTSDEPLNSIVVCAMQKKRIDGLLEWHEPIEDLRSERLKEFFIRKSLFGGAYPLKYGFGAPTSTLLIPRNEAINIGGFDPAFRRLEDVDFVIRFLDKGGLLLSTSRTFISRQMINKATNKADINLLYELKLLDKHGTQFGSAKTVQFTRRWLKLRCDYLNRNYAKCVIRFIFVFALSPFEVVRRLNTTVKLRILRDAGFILEK